MKTHRKCAPFFKFSAVVALGAVAFPTHILELVVLPILAASVYGTVYSYKIYSEQDQE